MAKKEGSKTEGYRASSLATNKFIFNIEEIINCARLCSKAHLEAVQR